MASNQAVIFYMNVKEFGTLFTKPLYYSLISALVLSSIALIRVNIKNSSSISWYGIHTALTFLKKEAAIQYQIVIQALRITSLAFQTLSSGKQPKVSFL